VVFSLLLFLLSLFVIRALCILCIGLYVVNVLLLMSTWLLAFRGDFVGGLVEGVRNIVTFLRTVSAPKDPHIGNGARFSLVSLVLLAACSWAVGPLMLKLFNAKLEPGTEITHESFLAWKRAPAVTIPLSLDGGMSGDHAKGDPGAPIKIVEFADFECPGCRRMYFNLIELLQDYPGKYQLVFRNYPLDHRCNPGIKQEFHKHACAAALFSRCAGEQGRFWEALDWLFSLPELEGYLSPAELRQTMLTRGAQGLELDPEGLAECMDSPRQVKKIQDDIAVADKLGLESTPAFWINGKRFPKPTVEGLKMVFSSILGAE
jgi:protein-disulfide isomerase